MSASRGFCTFSLDDFWFGVAVGEVQEVIRYQRTTPVPLGPGVIHGLMNLRGQIVTVIDLRRRLGMSPRPPDEGAMNIVVRTEEGPIALLAERVGDVVEVDEDAFERLPETFRGIARELSEGAFRLEHRLVLVLAADRVIDVGAREKP